MFLYKWIFMPSYHSNDIQGRKEGISMAMIDSAYQYYLSTYANSTVSRYDTHKKSQLRDVYNQIVKINKNSPLYKIKDTKDVTKYAIDIKEAARRLQNVISSLSDVDGGMEDVFSKQIAQSSDEEIVTAEYIGKDSEAVSGFEIQVRQLASNQINGGSYLNPNRLDFSPGTYSFDLNTNSHSYEFQYTISDSDTNLSVLQKLAKLIHTAGIGVTASVNTNENGQAGLFVASKQTGINDDASQLFEILPSTDAASMSALHTLGIETVQTHAKNSLFLLNGKEHTSYSNSFTVDNRFDVTLHAPSKDDEIIRIGFKTNTDAIADNLEKLADAYNQMIDLARTKGDGNNPGKLIRDIGSVVHSYSNELEAIGISLDANSYLSIDRSLIADAVSAEDAIECFEILNHFKDALSEKTASAYLNPMSYVDKVVVAYKNPGRSFASPYITSIYSGMMLDRYC